jgi:hypothetical protein
MQTTERFPAAPAWTPPVSGKRFPIMGILVGILATALIALVVFGVVQTSNLGNTKDELAISQDRVAASRSRIDELEGRVEVEQDAKALLDEQVSDQQVRLSACSRAASLSVKMDGIMHKLVNNALLSGSLSEWSSLWDQYNQLGDQWAPIASKCSGTAGDFTFN